MELPCDPTLPLLGTCPKASTSTYHEKAHASTAIAAPVPAASKWKEPRSLQAEDGQ